MFNRFINYLIYKKDLEDPQTAMQGRYFVITELIFISLTFLAIPYYLLVATQDALNHPEIMVANLVFLCLLTLIMLSYRKFGKRVLLVNLMTLLGFLGNYTTYHTTGGIYSTDCIWGILISCYVFLVGDKRSGIFWMVLTILNLLFFYYAELQGWHLFFADMQKTTSTYFFSNYFLASIFMLIVISLYDSMKNKFVTDLRASKSEIESQKKVLELQKKSLETQREDILSSIAYAKKIQEALLPHEEIIARGIPLSFLFYQPRDIVSGDFYWFHEIDRDNYLFACGDCTGHGVPGAFMTVIGSNLLSQIAKENITGPGEILAELDRRVNEALRQDHARYSEVQDGMDLSLISVNKSRAELTYTSAKRPAFFIRNNEMQELKGSKLSIGGMRTGVKKFAETTITYQQDDLLYLFTDGYIDQFGGPDNKKFMIKRFRELIMQIHKQPLPEQKRIMHDTISAWIGKQEQTDDILVAGIRF